MPIPNKGFFDPEKTPDPTDSVVSAIDRHMQMEAAAAEKAKQLQAEEARQQQRHEAMLKEARASEDQFAKTVSTLADPGSREAIMQRIREMREESVEKPYVPGPVHPAISAQTAREQEQGRIAQQAAQKIYDEQQALRIKALKEQEDKLGHMEPVHRSVSAKDQTFTGKKPK